MARTSKEESIYKVSIHKNGGYTYAYTNSYELDKNGARKYYQIHWGKVEGGKFIPGTRYITASREERNKLIFPADWDLSEILQFTGNNIENCIPKSVCDNGLLYGDCWLLQSIAKKIGLTKILEEALENKAAPDGTKSEQDKITAEDVLTLSIFSYLTGFSFSRLCKWQRIACFPSETILTEDIIEKKLSSVTGGQCSDVFKRLVKKNTKNISYILDSTSTKQQGGESDSGNDAPIEGKSTTESDVIVYSYKDGMTIPVLYARNLSDAESILGNDKNVFHPKPVYYNFEKENSAVPESLIEEHPENVSIITDGIRNSKKGEANGMLLVAFVTMVLSFYARCVWKHVLPRDKYKSVPEVFDEIRSIRWADRNAISSQETVFTAEQIEICKAFSIKVPVKDKNASGSKRTAGKPSRKSAKAKSGGKAKAQK